VTLLRDDPEFARVLLETGYGPGEWPCEMVSITPLMCAPLGIDPAVHEDTAPFSVRALKPTRTLLEKLALLHHIAAHFDAGPTAADERCGRHYHDVARLLADRATRDGLQDRPQFDLILAEMERISAGQYGGWTPRPDGGYSKSPAFDPRAGSPLWGWLKERYEDAAALMPSKVGGRWPTFPTVLRQITQHAELL
jgi:Nucleotidyl transferase AbiEii toxin, Type IV TA system